MKRASTCKVYVRTKSADRRENFVIVVNATAVIVQSGL